MTMELTEFGKPVDAPPPPPEDVHELGDLLQQLA
jgi:hypothetical protein